MIVKSNNKDIKILYIVFFFMGLFPILPFHFKPVPIIFALIIGFYIFFKQRGMVYSAYYFYNCLLLIPYLISLLYSKDFDYGIRKVGTMSSLVLMPFFFLLISKINNKEKKGFKFEKLFITTFYLSSIFFCGTLFIYIYSIGFFNNTATYDLTMSYIEHKLWVFNEHPIYASIFLSLSIIFSVQLFFNSTNKKVKTGIIIGNIFIIITILFLSRKGVIISLFFSFFYLLIKQLNKMKILKNKLRRSIVFILVLFFIFSSLESKRMHELFDSTSYTNPISSSNSTSIRLAIYKCALKNIPEAGWFGFGIGDVKEVLINCYKKTSEILVKWRYNTHNEYLNYWLACGIIGFLTFLFSLMKMFKLSLNSGDFLFSSIIIFYAIEMLAENVLDRQNGVILFSFLINFFTFKNINSLSQKKLI